jgi:hypothetical protein
MSFEDSINAHEEFIMSSAPDNYELDPRLVAILKNGGFKAPKKGDNIMDVFYTMNAKTITTAWILSELPKYINTEYVNSYFGGRIGAVLQLAAIGRALRGKPIDFTLKDGESIYAVASVPESSPNIIIPPKWKAGKIEPIPSGFNIFQWPNWKEGALATFAQCGLYRV